MPTMKTPSPTYGAEGEQRVLSVPISIWPVRPIEVVTVTATLRWPWWVVWLRRIGFYRLRDWLTLTKLVRDLDLAFLQIGWDFEMLCGEMDVEVWRVLRDV